jgi:molybdopterin converting factor subunit 1
MTITVRLFARWREMLGRPLLTVELDGTTVADLRALLATQFPDMAELLARTAIAVNNDYADATHLLHSTDDIALIPPVSGGVLP